MTAQQLQSKLQFFISVIAALVISLSVVIALLLLTSADLTRFLQVVVIALLLIVVCSVLWFRHKVFQQLSQFLSPHFELEQWAGLARVNGDYKPLVSKHMLADAINQLIGQLKDVRLQGSQVDKVIRESALLDIETGIGNREFFNNRLDAFLHEEDAQGIVLLIHFNDADVVQSLHGQQLFLTLMEQLIQCVQYRLRFIANYFIARRSEYELAVLLPNYYIGDVAKLCERLLSSFAKVNLPVGIKYDEFVHIGASYFSNDKKSYQIMSATDMALRSAQLQGPSQWFMYEQAEVDQYVLKGSLKWRTLLTQAIKNDAFVIFFQPVMASHIDCILHHEALAKVRDHDGKLISARLFLPMAQKCGLSADIDMLVFEHICRILQYEQCQQDDCSVNLSLDALLSDKFKQAVITRLSQNKNIASRLIVEISEYHLVSHLAELSVFICELNQIGVRILADKVGQYILSANYLNELPINYVKLHRSIVLDIHHKTENQVFVQSMKSMCSRHHVVMLALGVETQEEWQMLVRLGVSGGQGHFFTEPVEQVAKAIHLP